MPRLTRITFYLLLAWWVVLSAGCRAAPKIDRPTRQDSYGNSLAWSANIARGRAGWLAEARTRFADPFVFVCHGDTTDKKRWLVAPDDATRKANIEAVGWLLHGLMPDRDVVLVSCNAAAVTPRLPKRVWYCKRAVWSEPWRTSVIPPDDDCAADIWEFREGSE